MKKKVFFLLPTIGFGGAEKVYLEIATKMSNKFDVTLIYFTKIQDQRNIEHEKLKSICLNVSNVRGGFFKLINLLRKEKPDIVFSNIEHLNNLTIIIKVLLRFPFKLYIRHTSILSFQQKSKVKLQLLKILYSQANIVIFQSKYMQMDFLNTIPIKNSIIIPNPVDIEDISIKSKYIIENIEFRKNSYNFCILGRLVKVKNIPYLLYRLREYLDLNSKNIHIYIIGDGPQKDEISKLVKELNLEKNITLLGKQGNPYAILKEMDGLINVSLSEGFPNVLLEALALNIPIFVRKHPGGTKEIMENLMLEMYYTDEIDFSDITANLEKYPSDLKVKVSEYYHLNKIVSMYEKLDDIEINK